MDIIELIKVIIIGIVEGITEWLPISSTGHMLLVDEFIHMNVTPEFREMFLYVIQLGAILAVIILFWNKMWPFQSKKKNGSVIKKETFVLWFKVVIACIPGFVAYLLLDFVDNCYVVAAALIVYGVLFIVIENWNRGREPRVKTLEEISYKDAFIIGLFQALSIIPGTSRSGSTNHRRPCNRCVACYGGGVYVLPCRAGHGRRVAFEDNRLRLFVYKRRAYNAHRRLRCGLPCIRCCDKIPHELY